MPGDLAAAVGVYDRNALEGPLVRLGTPTGGVDRRVFQQQQGVGTAADPGFGQVALQLPGGEVLENPQLADVDRARLRSD